MKVFAIALATLIGTALTSCSKCYECRIETEIQTPDTTYTSYQTQELCTANNKELEEKEDQGYVCN